MYQLSLFVIIILPVCRCDIMIYRERPTKDISNLIGYFGLIDNIVILEHNFSASDLKNNNISMFVYPGGSSNISDSTTGYWKYVNLTIYDPRPKVAICLGFEHFLKARTAALMKKCYIKKTWLGIEYHNHKWCITEKSLLRSNKTMEIVKYKEYNNIKFVNEIMDIETKTLGYAYHPEVMHIHNIKKALKILENITALILSSRTKTP